MSDVKVQGGVGFFGWLTLLFIGLKLTGYITWSWWAVTAPLWAPATIFLVIAAVCLAVGFFAVVIGGRTISRMRP